MFDTLKHNGIIMNLVSREVKRHDVTIKLRDAEFRLLAILLKDPKRVFTRSELINDLWEQPDKIDYRTIDVMMGRLRKSLTLPNRTDAIRAVRGLGYGLSIDDPLITKRRNRKPVNSQDSIQVQEL
jgi:two-component system phosphate regulon response regulator PhoB